MKFKIGDRVVVGKCSDSHHFPVGETVEIIDVDDRETNLPYWARNSTGRCQWIEENGLKLAEFGMESRSMAKYIVIDDDSELVGKVFSSLDKATEYIERNISPNYQDDVQVYEVTKKFEVKTKGVKLVETDLG